MSDPPVPPAPPPCSPRLGIPSTKPKLLLKHIRHSSTSSSNSNTSFGYYNNNNNNNMLDQEETAAEANHHKEEEEEDVDDLLFLPPGRMGVRRPSSSSLSVGSNTSTSGLPRGGGTGGGSGGDGVTRSRSPSLNRKHFISSNTNITLEGSFSSSMDNNDCATTAVSSSNLDTSSTAAAMMMNDILTDRAGISDDLSDSQRNIMLLMKLSSNQAQGLPAVVERMSEDTLEDIHAFSDITSTSARVSVCSSNYPGDTFQLEPLCEEEEEEEEVAITITNLENLDLKDKFMTVEEEEDDEEGHDNDEASNQAVDMLEQQPHSAI